MAWKLFNKGKNKARDKVFKLKKKIGKIWVKVYRDVYTTIKKRDNSEQFKLKLQIIKARIWKVNKELITLLEEIRTL